MLYGNKNKIWILPIGFFAIANSHIISFIMISIITAIFVTLNIYKAFKENRIKSILIAGVLSIVVSTSVFLPILEQTVSGNYKVFNNGTSEDLSTKSLLITQIFMNEYTYNNCKTNAQINDQMNFGNGILLLVLPLFILTTKWNEKKDKRFIWQLYMMGVLILLVTTVLFPWRLFKMFDFIQLPWRLNVIISLCFSIVGAYTFYYTINNKDLMYVLAIIIVVSTAHYLDNVQYSNSPNIERKYTDIGQGEYLPINLNLDNAKVYDVEEIKKEYQYTKEKGIVSFETTKEMNSKKINVPLIYYKGYKAYIKNDKGKTELEVKENEENGLLIVNNNNLEFGKIEIKYEMTEIQKIAYVLTYGTIICIIIYMIIYKKRKGEKKCL